MATYGDGGLERQNQFTEEIRKFLEEATDDNEEFIFPEKVRRGRGRELQRCGADHPNGRDTACTGPARGGVGLESAQTQRVFGDHLRNPMHIGKLIHF